MISEICFKVLSERLRVGTRDKTRVDNYTAECQVLGVLYTVPSDLYLLGVIHKRKANGYMS